MSPTQSVYDTDIMEGANYDIIGEESGLKFYKLYDFPAAFVPTMEPAFNKTDYGIRTEMETSIVFQELGFVPNTLDFVSFKGKQTSDIEIFQVKHVELTYLSKPLTFYKIDIQGSGFYIDQIEQQVIGEYGYLDINNSFLPYDDYILSKMIVANLMKLSGIINDSFNISFGMRKI
jgi:hypothetical protein